MPLTNKYDMPNIKCVLIGSHLKKLLIISIVIIKARTIQLSTFPQILLIQQSNTETIQSMKKLVHHRLHGNKITSCIAKHTYTIDLQDAAMLEKAHDGYKTVIHNSDLLQWVVWYACSSSTGPSQYCLRQKSQHKVTS